jgi:hypothetical protein
MTGQISKIGTGPDDETGQKWSVVVKTGRLSQTGPNMD